MYKIRNSFALAANVVLGVVSLFLYSVIYGIFMYLQSAKSINPGGTMISFGSSYPGYFRAAQTFNRFPHLGFFENNVFYPLGIGLIISLVFYSTYKIMKDRVVNVPSVQ